MNAWESDVIECKKCIHCDFRAERDKERKSSFYRPLDRRRAVKCAPEMATMHLTARV